MKTLLSIFLAFLFALLPARGLFAQEDATELTDTTSGDFTLETEIDENTTKATNKYFDLTLSEGVQSPLDKSLTYTLTIVPHISSSKTQINWDSSSTIKITPKHSEFVTVTEGETYTYKANAKPTASGTYKVSVSVIAWQYDTNYTNTVSNSLELSKGLVSQPVTPEYTILVVIEVLVVLGIASIAIWGGVELSRKALKRTKAWLTPPR